MTESGKKRSRKEEAEYWETHTIDEVEGEEVEIVVRKPLSSVFSIRLNPEDVKQLREMASAQGVGVTTMARMLLRQCLRGSSGSLQIPWGAGYRFAYSFAHLMDQVEGGPEIGEHLDRLIESLGKHSNTLYLRPANPEEQPKQNTES